MHGPTFFGQARLQHTLNTISHPSVVLEESEEMPETENYQKNSNMISAHVQSAISEHLEKAMSFNVGLVNYYWRMCGVFLSCKKVDNGILLCHHPTILLFQFGPLI